MKQILTWSAAALLVAGLAFGCCNKKKAEAEEPAAGETAAPAETCLTAIDRYLTDSIGKYYAPAEICIPFHSYLSVDESNAEDIVVLGDFWVFNYDVAGDTLKTVSGGNHPGKMHVRKDADGHFEVTSFEAVADGADNEPSARRIFDEKFAEYQALHSDDGKFKEARIGAIASYVKEHGLPVKLYQDYGWPAEALPN